MEAKYTKQFKLMLDPLLKIYDELTGEMFHASKFPLFSPFHFDMPTIDYNVDLHVTVASGMIHHQLRPPDALMSDKRELLLKDEDHQVVSFPAPSNEDYEFEDHEFPNCECEEYEFDYGNFGKTTCIWINHGLNELPQLLILCKLFS